MSDQDVSAIQKRLAEIEEIQKSTMEVILRASIGDISRIPLNRLMDIVKYAYKKSVVESFELNMALSQKTESKE